jgi:MFS transporter, MHS family, proline/betaine transporter
MTNGTLAGLMAAEIAFGLLNGAFFGPLPALLAELFPTSVRYTGMALAYNFSATIFGGTAPMASVWLLKETGTPFSIAGYMVICAALSLAALTFYKDRFRQTLNR